MYCTCTESTWVVKVQVYLIWNVLYSVCSCCFDFVFFTLSLVPYVLAPTFFRHSSNFYNSHCPLLHQQHWAFSGSREEMFLRRHLTYDFLSLLCHLPPPPDDLWCLLSTLETFTKSVFIGHVLMVPLWCLEDGNEPCLFICKWTVIHKGNTAGRWSSSRLYKSEFLLANVDVLLWIVCTAF